MKKLIGLAIFVLVIGTGSVKAQEVETKSKPAMTKKDAVHNIFHPRHRRHSAYKTKTTVGDHKRKVLAKPNEVEIKNQ